MILGTGIDLVHLVRIRSLRPQRTERLATRILHPLELSQYRQLDHPHAQTAFLATRWAVKEATYKACYPLRRLTWKEVRLEYDARKPVLRLEPTKGTETAPVALHLHCSISHDGEYLVASVVVESG